MSATNIAPLPLGFGALRTAFGQSPELAEGAYVAEGALVIGGVRLAEGVSIWPGAVLRADDGSLLVGSRTNIQDGAVIHGDAAYPVAIGAEVTVGHTAVVHGCSIEDGALIGIGATVLDKAVVGHNAVVAAGALITEGFEVPPNTVVRGVPARIVGERNEALAKRAREIVSAYDRLRARYLDAALAGRA